MKTLGLLGGMSWESTAIYYRLLNEIVRERLGGLHSARLLLWSFDFAEIAERQHARRLGRCWRLLVEARASCEAGGAEGLRHLHQHHAQTGRPGAGVGIASR